jgi:molybdopterin molybdotransferase
MKGEVRGTGFQERCSVAEALRVLLPLARPSKEETLVRDALGRVLSEEVVAERDLPPFHRAAMDGYALKGEETFGASQTNPLFFRVVGEMPMGRVRSVTVGEFEAVKVTTGSPLPEGADAVMMIEYTREEGGAIEVCKAIPPGTNVSRRGEDVRKGERVLEKGHLLRPQDLGVLSALGREEVAVFRRPRVAILSTGDELREAGDPLEPGEIYDCNGPMLASLVEKHGGVPVRMGIFRDEYAEIEEAVRDALACDVVITSGATSVGERDWLPRIAEELGEVLVHGVAMRPGEPTGFARVGERVIFLLPGYPVAAHIAFEVFCRPFLQRLQGMEPWDPSPVAEARLERKVASQLGRRDFLRVRLMGEGDQRIARPIRTSGSGILSSLVRADGLVVIPENTEGLEEGARVQVRLFTLPAPPRGVSQ